MFTTGKGLKIIVLHLTRFSLEGWCGGGTSLGWGHLPTFKCPYLTPASLLVAGNTPSACLLPFQPAPPSTCCPGRARGWKPFAAGAAGAPLPQDMMQILDTPQAWLKPAPASTDVRNTQP